MPRHWYATAWGKADCAKAQMCCNTHYQFQNQQKRVAVSGNPLFASCAGGSRIPTDERSAIPRNRIVCPASGLITLYSLFVSPEGHWIEADSSNYATSTYYATD
jgi:hypothetical protein